MPHILENTKALSRHYMNQPVILPEKAQQVADLTHTLRLSLANSYTSVAVELSGDVAKGGLFKKSYKREVSLAISRAISLLTQELLLCFQLYVSVPRTVWSKLHYLYQLAVSLKIEDVAIDNSQDNESRTIRQLYTHAVLLGCIKANQLRRDDLALVNGLLPLWADKVAIESYEKDGIPSLFVVNTKMDRSPVFAHLLSSERLSECQLQISTSNLAEDLRRSLDEAENNRVVVGPKSISVDLVKHLILAWGKCSKRSFMRMESDSQLEICFGVNAAHYFASDGISIDSLIVKATTALEVTAAFDKQHTQEDFEKAETDAQSEADEERSAIEKEYDTENIEMIDYEYYIDSVPVTEGSGSSKYSCIRVNVLNASPGGYSISLPDPQDKKLFAGDLIALRETESDHWSIATIRWLHRPNKEELTFGVELLSPAFMPSIYRKLQANQEPGGFEPVLMLPEVSVTNQDCSLLLPVCDIAPGQILQVLERDQVKNVRIVDQIARTRVYSQYSYVDFDAANDANDQSEEEFDALWSNL